MALHAVAGLGAAQQSAALHGAAWGGNAKHWSAGRSRGACGVRYGAGRGRRGAAGRGGAGRGGVGRCGAGRGGAGRGETGLLPRGAPHRLAAWVCSLRRRTRCRQSSCSSGGRWTQAMPGQCHALPGQCHALPARLGSRWGAAEPPRLSQVGARTQSTQRTQSTTRVSTPGTMVPDLAALTLLQRKGVRPSPCKASTARASCVFFCIRIYVHMYVFVYKHVYTHDYISYIDIYMCAAGGAAVSVQGVDRQGVVCVFVYTYICTHVCICI